MNRVEKARQLRRAIQLFLQTLTDESQMMEAAAVYPAYAVNRRYPAGEIFSFGENADGEPQLYRVIQAHVSQADWNPAALPALYEKLGFSPSGLPLWTQPLSAADAYQAGDMAWHQARKWVSQADNNVWEPGVYGWEEAGA